MSGTTTDNTIERPPAELIRRSCRLEAAARKPGNVHPERSFADLTHADFLTAADAASPWLAQAGELGVGVAVERAVAATRTVVASNVNLGIALLIAPLAAVPREASLADGIAGVLSRLTLDDTRAVYRAIRTAAPGGLGAAPQQDVAAEPSRPLVDVMRLAADRDRIARQYANGFADVLHFGVPRLLAWWEQTQGDWELAIIGLHLSLLAEFPDTLIQRKCGADVAAEASQRARQVLDAGWPAGTGRQACAEFDDWLRADGHRRNPGATADLIAATLFVALRDHRAPFPDV